VSRHITTSIEDTSNYTIEDFLISLRTKLIKARNQKDFHTLGELSVSFTLLYEYAIEAQLPHQLIVVTEWVNIIPSEDKIREALQ